MLSHMVMNQNISVALKGGNVSPLLFSLCLNDLEDCRLDHGCKAWFICLNVYVNISIVLLLYADDAVLLSDTKEGIQKALSIELNGNLW